MFNKQRRLIKMLVCTAVCVLGLAAFSGGVNAEGEYATISGGGSVGVGDKVSVSVNISNKDGMWGVEGAVSYDASILKYVGGSGATINGGGGQVKYTQEFGGTETKKAITITFEAIGTGTTNVNLSSCIIVGSDVAKHDCSGGKATVKVGAEPQQSQTPSQSPNNEKKGNARLSSLNISPGSLSPAFSSGVFNYVVEVPEGTTTLTVSAKTADSTSKVKSVNGAKSIEHGENTVTVITEASDGTTLTYKLKVYCGVKAPGSEETPGEGPNVSIDGKRYKVSSSIPESDIPAGFTEATATLIESEIKVLKNETMKLTLAYLTEEGGEDKGFYIFNEKDSSFIPFYKVTLSADHYAVLLYPESDTTIPANLSMTQTTVLGKTFYALSDNKDKEGQFLYFYGVNDQGERGWYRYDVTYGSFQRCDITTLGETESQLDLKGQIEQMKLFGIIGAVVGLILLIIIVILIIKLRGRKPHDDFEDEDEDDELTDEERLKNAGEDRAVKDILAKEEIEREKELEENKDAEAETNVEAEADDIEEAVEEKAEEAVEPENTKKVESEPAVEEPVEEPVPVEPEPEEDFDFEDAIVSRVEKSMGVKSEDAPADKKFVSNDDDYSRDYRKAKEEPVEEPVEEDDYKREVVEEEDDYNTAVVEEDDDYKRMSRKSTDEGASEGPEFEMIDFDD